MLNENKKLSFQYTKLTFIKSQEEELNQLQNTVFMENVFNSFNSFMPLGKALVKSQYGYTASAKDEGDCKLLRISDINEGLIDWASVPYCDCNEFIKYKLSKGDILIARTGGTTGKTICLNDVPHKSVFASYLIRLTINSEFNPEYIFLFLNSYLFWNQILEMKNGTAQPNVNAEKMKELLFPSCPKDVQNELVKYKKDKNIRDKLLKNIDTKFNKLKTIYSDQQLFKNETDNQSSHLSLLRQAILQEAVEGKLTAEWRKANPDLVSGVNHAEQLLEKIKAEKEQLVREGKIKKQKPLAPITDEEKPFDLPEGWAWCRLGETGFTQTGSTPSTLERGNFGDYIPFITPEDIYDYGIKYNNRGLSKKGLTIGRLINKNSILMVCIGGSIGKSFYTDRDVSCNQQINTITPFINVNLVNYFLKSKYFQREVWDKAMKSSTPIINKGKWERIPIPIPSQIEQKAIVECVDRLMTMVDELKKQVIERKEKAEQLMQAVLREAFSA